MSDDDDWFERALRENQADGDDLDDPDGADHDAWGDAFDDSDAGESESDTSDSGDDASNGPTGPDGGDSAVGDGVDAGGDDRGSPFDDDFASALQDAPEPDFGSEQPSRSGDQGGSDPFGGGGDFGGEGPETFDDEEFESDLERLDIGIEGLDQMILGGVPRRSLMVAIGSAGTGKTTLGLQFLHHGLEQGENGVYITLEESHDRITSTANEKGWGFDGYADDDRLAVVDIDPIEMANSLDSIQNDLPKLIEEFGADRLVLDSVSLLEMMYDDAARRRSQVFGFTRALKKAGITTLLTSEADRNHAYASRFGIVEYLADAVFVLQYVRPSDFRETRLAIEIQKIRDANHSRETKPYDLTDEGISVYRQANIF